MLTTVVCESCRGRVEVSAEEDNPTCPSCGNRVHRGVVSPKPSAPPNVAPDPRALATARLELLRSCTAYSRTRNVVGWVVLLGLLASGALGILGLLNGDLIMILVSVCLGTGVVALGLLSLVLIDIADALVSR